MAISILAILVFAILSTALAKKARELRLYRKSAEAALDRFRRLECLKQDQFGLPFAW
jgi:hypothetical protein